MNKIVKEPVKVDFHIHSFASEWKDKDKVKNCKVENLEVLIKKVNENNVNMISITDHDNFDYNIYSNLKKKENDETCSLKKVLPGVEFCVKFDESEPETIDNVLHIIAIFDDDDNEKIKDIQKKIFNINKNKPNYKDHINCFSEREFKKILTDIGIDFILISHQKNSLSSQNKKKHDTNNLKNWQNLFFIGFFDALEFANPKNEIMNKYFIKENEIENVSFITGTDCHEWENYPNRNDFKFTYLKCLPTFKGLVMSLTNQERIKIGENFTFFNSNNNIDKISIKNKNDEYLLELSKGMNAIIGDNSVGKSLLLHKLDNYNHCKKQLKSSYEKYLKENNITIGGQINKENIYIFDAQGKIREIFAMNGISSVNFIKTLLPNCNINYETIKQTCKDKIKKFVNFLKYKQKLEKEIEELKSTNIKFNPNLVTKYNSLGIIDVQHLQETHDDYDKKIKKYTDLNNKFDVISNNAKEIINNDLLNKKDKNKLNAYLSYIEKLINKIRQQFNINVKEKNKIMTIINSIKKNK